LDICSAAHVLIPILLSRFVSFQSLGVSSSLISLFKLYYHGVGTFIDTSIMIHLYQCSD